jgi:hypothetical protein
MGTVSSYQENNGREATPRCCPVLPEP